VGNSIKSINDGTVLATSPVGTYQGITHNTLAFDKDDVAYTIARRSSSSVLQSVNLTTGQTTDLLDLGIADISAIAFAPANVIPEPSAGSLLIFGTVTSFGRRRYRVGS
jgi:hypothetical protein